MREMNDFEREMLENIDVEAIAREFEPKLSIERCSPQTPTKPQIKTVAESTRCKKTGKVQFADALIALEALRQWKMKDPNMCWDLKRMRVYRCKKCHQFHLGKK